MQIIIIIIIKHWQNYLVYATNKCNNNKCNNLRCCDWIALRDTKEYSIVIFRARKIINRLMCSYCPGTYGPWNVYLWLMIRSIANVVRSSVRELWVPLFVPRAIVGVICANCDQTMDNDSWIWMPSVEWTLNNKQAYITINKLPMLSIKNNGSRSMPSYAAAD